MTTTATETPTVSAALVRVMADVGAVGKDGFNNQQGFNFRGIDAVMKAVHPALVRHGVVVVPDLQTVAYDAATTRSGGNLTLCRVVVAFVFTGPAGDTLRATVAAEAMDSGDKATAKAMSVAFRTALIQSLTMPTDEPDPDASSYETVPHVNTTTGEVTDPETAVREAMAAATDIEALRAVYRAHSVGSAPQHIRDEFDARANELAQDETAGSDPDPDATAAAEAAAEGGDA
ncbi:ERF family protein [Nocardioides sp. STR2]|uniref:ERF family protein n=1 Tax=Nocardioides pini TaxID=2975053 RepID=A0ABT4CCQ1_9ACTN|nr:ERF family protein [Nocardioides pini]MCY4726733.1 ERF family protein [Nocardioides pini]